MISSIIKEERKNATLYNYIKSSTSYRVRIVMNLKNITCSIKDINLRTREHLLSDYYKINSLKRVPVYAESNEHELWHLTQSLAIISYLDELYPDPPIFPFDKKINSQVRAFSMIIACDVHPLNNLSVLDYLRNNLMINNTKIQEWYSHWVLNGFRELERLLSIFSGEYSFYSKISLADVCLIPQVFNAIRFKVPLDDFPNILRVYNNCLDLKFFKDVSPEVTS
jgi:maleylacetoacetate isomerase